MAELPMKLPRPGGFESRVERLTSDMDRRAGNRYEVFAPEGFRFTDGAHSRICKDADAAIAAAHEWIEACPDDCLCAK